MTRFFSLAAAVFLAVAFFAAATAGMVAARLPVVVYDGPSSSATPRYLLGKDYPLIVISETAEWLTICMHDGTSGHISRADARPGDTVVVLTPTVVRAEPSDGAAPVLNAGPQLLLANTGDVISGWLPVRHESGVSGFVPATDVWGHSGC